MNNLGYLKLIKHIFIGAICMFFEQNPFNQIQLARMFLDELIDRRNGNFCGLFQRIAINPCGDRGESNTADLMVDCYLQ